MTIIFNISHFSKPRSYPLPTGLTIRHGSPRLMSASSPLCRRASGRCIVRLCKAFGLLSRPGRGGKAGERASNPEVSVVGFR